MILAVILYFFSAFMIGAISLSYWIAYKMHKTQSVLSFAIFFTVTFIFTFFTFWTLVKSYYTSQCSFIYGSHIRAALLLASSIYLFFNTWRPNPDNNKLK